MDDKQKTIITTVELFHGAVAAKTVTLAHVDGLLL